MMMMGIASDVLNTSKSPVMEDMINASYVSYKQRPEFYIVPVVFSIIFAIGVIGNGTLILILLCNANMRNVPNIYVLSLALGDLLLIVTCVPFTSVIYTFKSWPWGLSICKVSEFVKDISIGVSVFTLAALAAERFCAIVNPIRRHVAGLNAKPLTVLTASLIWVLAIILALPAALFSHLKVEEYRNFSIEYCDPFPKEFGDGYKKGIITFRFLAYYVIPLCVIAAFYLSMARHLILSGRNMPGELPGREQIRARKRVGKMVLSFVIIFMICFLPHHIYMLWYGFSNSAYNKFWHVLKIMGFCLSFSNSCVNPIALYFISGTFRQSFNKYLCYCLPDSCVVCCGGRRLERGSTFGNVGSQRSRGIRGTFCETSFGSTFRRHPQESTGVFEMVSIEKTKPTPNDQRLFAE